MLVHPQSYAKEVFISLGPDCGAAFVLRDGGFRMEAYAFDWIISPCDAFCAAIEDDFTHHLTNLQVNAEGNGVIDFYGFNYTHDFPTRANQSVKDVECCGVSTLLNNWFSYISEVQEKYNMRIERFRKACVSDKSVADFLIFSENLTVDRKKQI